MADVTGPISTLPGAHYSAPAGTMCDDHPDRPATHRVQGETDSFGCEMHDLCAECYAEHKAGGEYSPDRCDWCKQEAENIRPTRDYEEGTCGPVYYVCKACRDRRDEQAREDDPYDDYDFWDDTDDFYEAESADVTEDDWTDPPAKVIPMNCKACAKPWSLGHKCRAVNTPENTNG